MHKLRRENQRLTEELRTPSVPPLSLMFNDLKQVNAELAAFDFDRQDLAALNQLLEHRHNLIERLTSLAETASGERISALLQSSLEAGYRVIPRLVAVRRELSTDLHRVNQLALQQDIDDS